MDNRYTEQNQRAEFTGGAIAGIIGIAVFVFFVVVMIAGVISSGG